MIIQSKIDETKDHMRKVARKLDQEKMEKARSEKTGAGTGASSYSMPSYPDSGGIASGDFDVKPSLKMHGTESRSGSSRGKGLQLGKGRKNKDMLESLRAEGETVETDITVTKTAVTSKPARAASEQVTPWHQLS